MKKIFAFFILSYFVSFGNHLLAQGHFREDDVKKGTFWCAQCDAEYRAWVKDSYRPGGHSDDAIAIQVKKTLDQCIDKNCGNRPSPDHENQPGVENPSDGNAGNLITTNGNDTTPSISLQSTNNPDDWLQQYFQKPNQLNNITPSQSSTFGEKTPDVQVNTVRDNTVNTLGLVPDRGNSGGVNLINDALDARMQEFKAMSLALPGGTNPKNIQIWNQNQIALNKTASTSKLISNLTQDVVGIFHQIQAENDAKFWQEMKIKEENERVRKIEQLQTELKSKVERLTEAQDMEAQLASQLFAPKIDQKVISSNRSTITKKEGINDGEKALLRLDYKAAREYFENISKTDSSSSVCEGLAISRINLLDSLPKDSNLISACEEIADKCIKLNKISAELALVLLKYYCLNSQETNCGQIQKRTISEVIPELESKLLQQPKSWELRSTLSLLYLRVGEREKAIEVFKRK